MNYSRKPPEFLPQIKDAGQKEIVVQAIAAIIEVWNAHTGLQKISLELDWHGPRTLHARLCYICGLEDFGTRTLAPGQMLPKFGLQISIFGAIKEEVEKWSSIVDQRFDFLLIRWHENIALVFARTALAVFGAQKGWHAALDFKIGMFQAADNEEARLLACEWVEAHFLPTRTRGVNEFP